MLKNSGKKFFLIATDDVNRRKLITEWINTKFTDAVIYTAVDYMECLVKLKNAPPNILITDFDLAKARTGQIIDYIILDQASKVGIVVLGAKADSQYHQDAITLGRLAFIETIGSAENLYAAITAVSSFAFESDAKEYHLRNLKAGEVLFREGDVTQNVFIVKKGELKAYHKVGNEQIHLGNINTGEFVGEMAYFNGEPRVATIEAITDCELIEIPPKAFERVIYQRPSWVKTLFATLSKRLKKKNSELAK